MHLKFEKAWQTSTDSLSASDRFGSLADLKVNTSRMSAFGGEAVILRTEIEILPPNVRFWAEADV